VTSFGSPKPKRVCQLAAGGAAPLASETAKGILRVHGLAGMSSSLTGERPIQRGQQRSESRQKEKAAQHFQNGLWRLQGFGRLSASPLSTSFQISIIRTILLKKMHALAFARTAALHTGLVL
jgi:hypothetical protein